MFKFTETFNVFIEKNANINHQDDLGLTPLHLAIQKRNFEGALLLINSSAINCNVSWINKKYGLILFYNMHNMRKKRHFFKLYN